MKVMLQDDNSYTLYSWQCENVIHTKGQKMKINKQKNTKPINL